MKESVIPHPPLSLLTLQPSLWTVAILSTVATMVLLRQW